MIVLVRSGRPARAGDGLRETVDRRDRIPACAPHHGQAVAQDDVEEQDEQLDVDEEQVDPNTVSE